jgi:3D-(3,5/4)-trihydroxycyclohexane-1,2-dione acylhydrolase (decyclizing)
MSYRSSHRRPGDRPLAFERNMSRPAGGEVPYFGGVWAIFGHGNVAGIGEALHSVRDVLPTFRAHNEQGMAHAAIAYRQAVSARASLHGLRPLRSAPARLNMVTAAALAHVNRLPVLFLPGDVFANRRPIRCYSRPRTFPTARSAVNDCFRPVSRYFDRITRPEQIIPALPPRHGHHADRSGDCGPVTLSLLPGRPGRGLSTIPRAFFEKRVWRIQRRPRPDRHELAAARRGCSRRPKKPLVIAGGGVLYSQRRSGRTGEIRLRRRHCRSARRKAGNPRWSGRPSRSTWRRSASPARRPPTGGGRSR